ncbi:site-specific integrase, partial [Pseudomonas sp.]|uniref:site-specific integrase n=1 Tax=Pseudomonas sp. TaxID=306 RepID=UPI00262F665C
MATFENPAHRGRLVVIPQVWEAFADLHFGEEPEGAIPITINGANCLVHGYQVNDSFGDEISRSIFNLPFLFHRNGEPWREANSYILNLVKDKHLNSRPTDEARRKASRLLDYLMFCESNNINWLDFSGRRLTQRPTYRYHRHLLDMSERGAQVSNQYTGVVYNFYEFVSKYWHDIDMSRVDTVREINISIENSYGISRRITVEKRSQTQSYSKNKSIPPGFVDDEGECLRPLTNVQLAELIDIIQSESWSAQERLIMLFAVMTGARKQTVLTLRVKHVEALIKGKLQSDGTYQLKAGPGTGIDTKNSKPQTLHLPKQLAEDLLVYVRSPYAKRRRQKFQNAYSLNFPGLEGIAEDEMYVFLSEQANCYYMASTDPRYRFSKTRPLGAVTDTLKKKLMKSASSEFSKDFT